MAQKTPRLLVVLLTLLAPLAVAAPATGADVTRPVTKLTQGPTGVTALNVATFRFRSNEKRSTFTCRLDQGRARPCSSPRTYRGLADGKHVFRVFATDRAGNRDRTPARRSFTVDTTPPDTSVAGGPAAGSVVSANQATFGLVSSEPGSTFTCALDSATAAACTTPASYAGLAEGAHTFSVRACDAVGNCDLSPASVAWTVDTVPPTTSIDSGPAEGVRTSNNDPSFTFSADPATGSLFECSLDATPFAVCSSPKGYTDLTDGDHTFSVRACDAVGNCDVSPATRSWTIDTTPPDTQFTGHPDAITSDNLAQFSFIAIPSADLGSFECSLDNAPYTTCAAQTSMTVTRNISHTFRVRACDLGGLCDLTPALWTWTVTGPEYTANNETDAPLEADFCRIAFPASGSVSTGQQFSVFGRVFEASLTPPAGSSTQVIAQVGYGPDGSDPRADPGWVFSPMTFNLQDFNEDEYVGSFTAPAPGSYDYVVRFSFDDGNTATYCDVDGAGSSEGATFETGADLGQLLVNP